MSGEGTNQGLIAKVEIITSPLPDVSVRDLREEVERLLFYAEQRQIASDADVKGATEDLAMMSGLKKAVESRRTEYVKPMNDEVTRINAIFKSISEPLERANKLTRSKVLEYQNEQERKRREAEEINAAKIALAQREAALNDGELSPDTNTTPVEVPEGAPKHVRASMGMASRTENWKWEVTDLSQVPREYLMIDAGKVSRLVKAGMRTIPGIRIYSEAGLYVTAAKPRP